MKVLHKSFKHGAINIRLMRLCGIPYLAQMYTPSTAQILYKVIVHFFGKLQVILLFVLLNIINK